MRALLLTLGVVSIVLSMNACAHQVGGKSVNEVFLEPQALALANAACRGDVGGIQNLVREGANVNATGLDDVSVLIWSLSCQNLRGIQALLDNGANPNHRIKYNLNPMSIAATYAGRTDILRALVQAGGNLNAVSDQHEETVLMTAFTRGIYTDNWDNYYYLLEAGADVNFLANKEGSYAGASIGWHASIFNRNCKILELIELGLEKDLEPILRHVKTFDAWVDGSEGERCLIPLTEKLETRIAELQRR